MSLQRDGYEETTRNLGLFRDDSNEELCNEEPFVLWTSFGPDEEDQRWHCQQKEGKRLDRNSANSKLKPFDPRDFP